MKKSTYHLNENANGGSWKALLELLEEFWCNAALWNGRGWLEIGDGDLGTMRWTYIDAVHEAKGRCEVGGDG